MGKKKWWNKPRVDGLQGSIAFIKGTTTKIMCPKCLSAPVVYNGNYFCDDWGLRCDWALAHPARSRRDRTICDAIGIDYS